MTPQHNADAPPKDNLSWVAVGAIAICMSLSFVFVTISLEGFSLAQSTGAASTFCASTMS